MDKWLKQTTPSSSSSSSSSSEAFVCPPEFSEDVFNQLPIELQRELIEQKSKARIIGESPIKFQKKNDEEGVQSTMWNAFVKEDASHLFTDVDFPPSPSSIDGQRVAHPTGLNSPPRRILCKCQIEVARRRVSKDGQNQGRFFLSCNAKLSDNKKCGFFQWDDHKEHSKIALQMDWLRCRSSNGFIFVGGKGFKAADIAQGGLGDCWFLSAVATIADGRPDLMERVCNHRKSISSDGQYIFNLFIDGCWNQYSIDDYLPVIKQTKRKSTQGMQSLAYSRAKANQLWVPLLEKAYAKAHSCYDAISGGHVCEAMLDLTGYPVETISFNNSQFDSELCWARLKSFHDEGFPLGAAAYNSIDGIVGHHAYSILEVIEVSTSLLGLQNKISSFYQEVIDLSSETTSSSSSSWRAGVGNNSKPMDSVSDIITGDIIRLLRLRNPWGKKEFTGALSQKSELWSRKLRTMLARETDIKGTFWITMHDLLRCFSLIDICKARVNWITFSHQPELQDQSQINHILCRSSFTIICTKKVQVSIMLLQRTKRGKSTEKYYYFSSGLIILQQLSDSNTAVLASKYYGPRRDTEAIELTLDVGEYQIYPLAFESVQQPYCLYVSASSDDITIIKNENINKNKISTHPLHLTLQSGLNKDISGWNKSFTLKGPQLSEEQLRGSLDDYDTSLELIKGGKIYTIIATNRSVKAIQLSVEVTCIHHKAHSQFKQTSEVKDAIETSVFQLSINPLCKRIVAFFTPQTYSMRQEPQQDPVVVQSILPIQIAQWTLSLSINEEQINNESNHNNNRNKNKSKDQLYENVSLF